MTPERAQEILNLRTWIGNIAMPTIEVGNIRNFMTFEEDQYVKAAWKLAPGHTCYYDILKRIANGFYSEANTTQRSSESG